MTPLIGLILRAGVPARFAKPLLGLIAFLALAGILWAAIAHHDRTVIKQNDAAHEAKLAPVITKAADNAAAQRSTDVIAIAQTEKDAHDAIAKAPETAPSPAAVALGCERLRHRNANTNSLPAICRHSSEH